MTYLTLRPTHRSLTRGFDSFFDDFFNAPFISPAAPKTSFSPNVNVSDTDSEVNLTLELPGMEKGDIKVSVAEGILTVSGKREFESEEDSNGCLRCEIGSGSFSRSFTLPDTVNSEKISADYKNGLLEISLPKLEEVKPKQIDVKIG